MKPHKNEDGLVEWFEHPEPCGKTLVYHFVPNCGFGNQMMEIAAAYGIAKRTGCHLRWTWKPSTLRKFELGPVGFAHTVNEGVPMIAARLGQGNIKLVREIERRVRETELPIFAVSCPFQDEKCFIEDTTLVEDYFRPNLEPMPLEVPAGATPVGIQIRRTDYVGHGRLDVVTPAYFHNAMEWMRDHVDNPHFFIVSDDPQWCRHRFEKVPNVTVMPPQNSIEGMRTLIACEHWIISNSTYGYWGAWLGERRTGGGNVVVPEIWHHKPGSYGDWEIIPRRWHRVSIKSEYRVTPITFEDHEVMEPQHKKAIAYAWRQDGATWHELRYSLRSLEKFLFTGENTPIYVLGTMRPPWLLPDSGRVKFIAAHSYRQALVTGLQIAEEVLWCNDDQVFLKPTTWDDVRQVYYLRDIGDDFLEKATPQNNHWRAGCLHVLKQIRRAYPKKKLRVFSTHLPYLFEREKSVDVFRRFGVFEKFPMELAYYHLFAKKPKLLGDVRATDENFGDAKFLNYTDATLTPALRAAIQKLLPDYASWELPAAF